MTPSLCTVEPEEDFSRVDGLSAWIPLSVSGILPETSSLTLLTQRGQALWDTDSFLLYQ